MSTKPDGGPAFPEIDGMGIARDGMALRDYFAAKALAGMMASPDLNFVDAVASTPATLIGIAKACYALSDAMLAERIKP